MQTPILRLKEIAGSLLQVGIRCLLSNNRYRLHSGRAISFTATKKVETTSSGEAKLQQQPLQSQRHEESNRYPAVASNHSTRNKLSRKSNERLSQAQNEFVETFQHASRDPLQHVLNHPSASIILRDACRCTRCKDTSTSQREFNVAHIPLDIRPLTAFQDAHGDWVVRWLNDMPGWEDHVSVYTPQQIERLERHMSAEHRTTTQLWNKQTYTQNRSSVDYHDYINSDAALAKTLYDFARYGLVFIENVPEDVDSVAHMAQRIAAIKSTFYGQTWDVKSIPNAKNVAYTNKYLGFHGDLLYVKEPPTVQYLHCLHNSCEGGESRFVDQFAAFDRFHSEDGEMANDLANTRLRYEYDNDGIYYSDIKPIVQWRADGHAFPRRAVRGATNNQLLKRVYRMFWSPQFLGSIIGDFAVKSDPLAVKKSVAAMKKYADILERDELVYEEKMIPDTCVMFDNLRVLHARNEFDVNTGKRWLRGTYLDAQDLWSTEVRLKQYMTQLEAANYPNPI